MANTKSDNPRDAILKSCVTESDKIEIKNKANAASLSTSDFLRDLALGYTVKAEADLVAIGELRQNIGLYKHLHNERLENQISTSELERKSLECLNLNMELIQRMLKPHKRLDRLETITLTLARISAAMSANGVSPELDKISQQAYQKALLVLEEMRGDA